MFIFTNEELKVDLSFSSRVILFMEHIQHHVLGFSSTVRDSYLHTPLLSKTDACSSLESIRSSILQSYLKKCIVSFHQANAPVIPFCRKET